MSKSSAYSYARDWRVNDNEYQLINKIGWRMIKQGQVLGKHYKNDMEDFGIKVWVYRVNRFGYNWRITVLDGDVCSIEKLYKVWPVI